MRYEEWVKLQPAEDQKILDKITIHNMSLTVGHNGNMYVDKGYLQDYDFSKSRYHLSSVEYENYLVDRGIKRADYPLVTNSPDNRWTTFPHKKEVE